MSTHLTTTNSPQRISSIASLAFSWRERQLLLKELQSKSLAQSQTYDVCIIGAGITGAAVARDAALRGLKVLVIDKGDIAHGTSSRSSRLVHGGVRYLENFDFRLVRESTYERAVLWKLSPHLVKPLGFIFPSYKNSRRSLSMLSIGLWLYDSLALFRLPSLHKKFNRQKTLEEIPMLNSNGLTGSIFYWDAQTHDAKLSLANALDAVANGAHILPKVEFIEATHLSSNTGSISGSNSGPTQLQLKDLKTNTLFNIQARSIVLAGGPWTDILASKFIPNWTPMMVPTRGSHIVVDHHKLPIKHAVVHFHPNDGRVLFSIPWGEFSIVGTTDLYDHGDPGEVRVRTDEIDYLLEACAHDFPSCPLNRDDILSTWCGIRPLVKESGQTKPSNNSSNNTKSTESKISRDHFLEWFEPNIAVISGGKLTTHREMARQTVELLINQSFQWEKPLCPYKPSITRFRPLPDIDLPTIESENPSDSKMSGQISGQIFGTSEAALSQAALRHICRTQMPLSLLDICVRRTDWFFKEPNNGWDLLNDIREVLCDEMQWGPQNWQDEIKAYAQYINLNVREPLGRPMITINQQL